MRDILYFDMEKITKKCYKCQTEKDHSEFARSSSARDGLQSMCKLCNIERHRAIADELKPNRVRHGKYYILPTEKKCSKCREILPIDHFGMREDLKRPLSRCRSCQLEANKEYAKNNPDASRHRNLKYKYGVTKEDYDRMFKEQNGVCGICKQAETSIRSLYLSIDHNHETGKVRGLLCRNCNSALGKLKDSIERMKAMIEWMEKNDG